jgi:TetR/AcrR family transcriptional regulator, transcriptional repressor for nem operon
VAGTEEDTEMARGQTGSKETTKTALLEAGTSIMLEKGYNNTGIQEVLDSIGVPKGSFYYYFDSKEDFALKIIEHHDLSYSEFLRAFLEDKSLTPIERLRKYCSEGMQMFEANQCRKGCLIGNLSQEMSDQSEVLRARLEEVLTKWRNKFAQCIKEGQDKGQITKAIDHVQLAEFFLCGWNGAILRAKTTKTTTPQKAFMQVMFEQILPA